MSLFREHLNRDDKPIIIFDGGTGTSFQNMNLTAEDFGGDKFLYLLYRTWRLSLSRWCYVSHE